MTTCLIEGCEGGTISKFTGRRGRICDPHWYQLDIKLREKWWTVTGFGKQEPTQELIEEIRLAICNRSK